MTYRDVGKIGLSLEKIESCRGEKSVRIQMLYECGYMQSLDIKQVCMKKRTARN